MDKQVELSTIKIKFHENPILFQYRNASIGDKGVIKQIFEHEDYRIQQWPQGETFINYYQRNTQENKGLIIDAGANIGASAVYFLEMFKNSFVYTIEPDDSNFQLLSINTGKYINKNNFHGAIAGEDGVLYLEDPGHSDWGFRTSKAPNESNETKQVKSISPDTILNEMKDYIPMIFKIDIEGGEQSLFSKNTEWMKRFPLIIIELHDWMLPFSGSAKFFLKAVANYEFDFLHKGENIFLFNRELLAPEAIEN
jgi:FkbM family methyltransferase